MEELKSAQEQQGRHSRRQEKWIGTGGASPMARMATILPAYGSARRTQPQQPRHQRCGIKREYKDLDDKLELGTRNIKVALRRLRKLARQGA